MANTKAIVLLLAGVILAECTVDVARIGDVPPAAPRSADNTTGPVPDLLPRAERPTPAPLTGQLVICAESNARWDVNVMTADGQAGTQLTNDGSSRAPAVSRDGTRVAFESHRDGNWEIYAMDASGARVTRLTRTLAFDGRPSWSPDGTRIAFASARAGDLDIWVMNADGTAAANITDNSPGVDDGPAWSPDGQWIAYTSWRGDTAQIFAATPDGKQIVELSQSSSIDQMPAWSPDGRQIAFVSDRDGQRAVYVAEFSTAGFSNARRLTFSGWDELPAWSPDGNYIAFVSPRPSGQSVYVVPASGGVPTAIRNGSSLVRSAVWAAIPQALLANLVALPAFPPPAAPPAAVQNPATLVPLKDVYLAPSYGRISDRVSDSFQALRAKVKTEAGWDYLGTLADMARQLTGGECGEGCQFMSWHKAGRAVDGRMEVESGGANMLEIVRQDQLGSTYWNLYLRAAKQDGSLGEPMTQPPWDMSNEARWTLAPHEGGVQKSIPTGYYVDFTELARRYGWERISSYDDDATLSWKENKLGSEYWHFQRTDGLTWYAALKELYSDQTLAEAIDWNALLKQGENEYLLSLKQVPAPAGAWPFFALFR